MSVIFITSSGRSGSKSIAHALDNIAGVKAFHSPFKLEDHNCANYLKHLKIMEAQRLLLVRDTISKGLTYVESAT